MRPSVRPKARLEFNGVIWITQLGLAIIVLLSITLDVLDVQSTGTPDQTRTAVLRRRIVKKSVCGAAPHPAGCNALQSEIPRWLKAADICG
jgi:hypothetical protein